MWFDKIHLTSLAWPGRSPAHIEQGDPPDGRFGYELAGVRAFFLGLARKQTPYRTVSLLPIWDGLASRTPVHSLLTKASRTSLISRRCPSGSWKKARISPLQAKGGVINSAPRERRIS